MTAPSPSAPIAEGERAGVLDALRGFALLGILVSHVPTFSGFEFLPPAQQAALDGLGIDDSLAALCEFLIRGKFFSLFSLLFGIGFSVQLESARRRGARFARHFTRRLAILFGIGLVHGLLWYGDILRDYALLGLLLLPSARWDARKTRNVAIAWLLARLAWPLLVFAIARHLVPVATGTAGGDPSEHFFQSTRAFASESWSDVFSANVALLRLKALQTLYGGKALSIVAMFFLGAAVGKARLHVDLASSAPLLRRVFWWCMPIGVAGNLVLVPLHAATPAFPPTLRWVADEMLFAIAVPTLAIAYASGFALLYRGAARGVLRAFAPAGRMALSTYVSQTWIGILLFYGVGLGWYDRVGPDGLRCDRARDLHRAERVRRAVAAAIPIRTARVVLASRDVRRAGGDAAHPEPRSSRRLGGRDRPGAAALTRDRVRRRRSVRSRGEATCGRP